LRTPTSVIPGRSSSGLREFPEVPTALTPVTGTTKPPRQWTLWVLLPLLGAAAATIAVTLNRSDNEARAATPPVEMAPLVQERSNESTSAGEDAVIVWWLHTDPEGAIVIIDGQRYKEPTPMKVELPRSEEPLAVRFELAGHQPREVKLAPVSSQNLQAYALHPIAAEPAQVKPVTNTGLRFTARKPKTGKPKGATDGSTPSKPGPTEATPAPEARPPKPDGELAEMPDFKSGKTKPPGG
jgi:hypothetical protein